jgi:hypothetical protein
LGLAALLPAQDMAPAVASPDVATAYTPDQLDQLTAPIALYPDALVALILPAATAPTDIVLANQYLQANPAAASFDNQPWDVSVKGLANYPEIIQWMATNLDWTMALGRAFLQQPAQVMESIQQLRAAALANGTLTQTPQQQVFLAGNSILIEPTSPDAICVPQYDPSIVFIDYPVVYSSPVIFFGPPRRVGPWLQYECDWDDYGIWFGVWHSDWRYYRDWRPPPGGPHNGALWHPDPVHQRELLRTVNRPVAPPPHPRLMANAPAVSPRPAPGSRPADAKPPGRPDPTGWHTDSDGHLAVPPHPGIPTGPRIMTSTPSSSPPARAPDLNAIRPATPVSPQPETPRSPQLGTPISPSPETPVSPRPVTSAPRPAPMPQVRATPPPSAPPTVARPTAPATPGPAFGGYERGTTVQDFSNRGQASRAAVSPPPAPAPRPAPAPVPQQREASPPPAPAGANGTYPRQH